MVPSASVTAIQTGKVTIAPSTGGGGNSNVNGTLEVIAVLAFVALLAGLVGLYMTRNRPLPVVAAAGPTDAAPPTSGFYTPPQADADHDWGSQTPGPPPPPPPPGTPPVEEP
ncbi:hypothetical protein acdb102_34920 [Acidothermaceae bacterium B102]|nr:hypothetical protein acdb102_34920 [Acidothermaceae bacterium B102]